MAGVRAQAAIVVYRNFPTAVRFPLVLDTALHFRVGKPVVLVRAVAEWLVRRAAAAAQRHRGLARDWPFPVSQVREALYP